MKRFFNGPIVILLAVMLALNFINGRFDNPLQWFSNTLEMIPGIVIGLSFHEFAHAFAAYKLGDMTPKLQGRVTLNPMAHIDPIGFIALIFCGFGWGQPVQINPNNFSKVRRDSIIVSLAGVFMNLLLAVLFAIILRFMVGSAAVGSELGLIVINVVASAMLINLVLLVFNLIPVPPLDGFSLITEIFHLRQTQFYYKIYDKGFLILMLLLVFNVLDYILNPAVNFLGGLLYSFIVY